MKPFTAEALDNKLKDVFGDDARRGVQAMRAINTTVVFVMTLGVGNPHLTVEELVTVILLIQIAPMNTAGTSTEPFNTTCQPAPAV